MFLHVVNPHENAKLANWKWEKVLHCLHVCKELCVKAMFLVTCNLVSISVLAVEPAVSIIMGANIGTSVTNTIVLLAQSGERNEFRLALAICRSSRP